MYYNLTPHSQQYITRSVRTRHMSHIGNKACTVFITRHDDVITWKHFPHHRPSVRKIHRSPVNSPHKGQWRGALMFSFIWASTNSSANNRDAGDLGRHRAHYDVIVMRRFQSAVRGHRWILFCFMICVTVSLVHLLLDQSTSVLFGADNLIYSVFWLLVLHD